MDAFQAPQGRTNPPPSDAAAVTAAPGARAADSRLLAALLEATGAHPAARKLLVGPDVNWGRELLLALARRAGGWIGWEATNLREVASELALVPLAERGARVANDIELAALVNDAIDAAADAGALSAGAMAMLQGLGFRTAMRDAVLELRTAGVAPAVVLEHASRGTPAHDLAVVAERYEEALERAMLADPAEMFRLAIRHFDREAPFTIAGQLFLAPSLALRGLPRQLAVRLLEAGASPLDADTPIGVEAPASLLDRRATPRAGDACSPLAWAGSMDFPGGDAPLLGADAVRADCFAAATPGEELREALRRAVAEGWRLDQVEIVTTDPDTYGIALDALSQRLGIGCTMLAGVPLARTRLGRAIERWFAWLADGLPADTLRHAIEAGELRAPVDDDAQVGASRLSQQLRRLKIGWGRPRYEAALAAARSGAAAPDLTRREDEDDAEFAARREAHGRALGALAALLDALLACTPDVPERGSDVPVRSSASRLARATIEWLALVPVHGEAEQNTASRLRTRLEAIAEVASREVSFGAALAELRAHLADLRAWPLVTSDRKPWSASPGMPHLTGLAHAGTTGRPRVFVVGLDGDRTSAGHGQDPFLPDALRARLGDGLATTALRQRERGWQVGQALASLRGRVTLSYATRGSLGERDAAPAAELLQAWRVLTGDAALGYDELRAALTPPACAVPALPDAAIDARDAWLAAIADGALLLDGTAAVLDAHAGLARGVEAERVAKGDAAGPYHGIVTDDIPVVGGSGRPVSPSAIEQVAKCPLAWLYRYGLGLKAPQDPEYDPDAWLSAGDRGTLLHKVYEEFGKAWQKRQHELHLDEAEADIVGIAREVIRSFAAEVPPPSEEVLAAESQALLAEAVSFLRMERALGEDPLGGVWLEFEREFGKKDEASWQAGGRALRIHGKIDRIDQLPDGSRRVVDYKTGGTWAYRNDRKQGPFRGGRTLQAALYSRVIEQLDGTLVTHFEYRFPTVHGGHEVVRYGPEELAEGERIVERVLSMAEQGHFVPTTDVSDCKYCDFQPVCRVTEDRWGNRACGRVAWAARASEAGLEVYAIMRRHRSAEET